MTASSILGLHLTSTLASLFLVNALLAYSAYPVFALGRMNLAFMAFAGVGGYTAAILDRRYGVPPAAAIAAGAAFSAFCAAPLGAIFGRVRGVYLAIASVSLVIVFQIVVTNLNGFTGGALGILGLPLVSSQLVLGLALAAVIGFFWILSRSAIGLAIRVQRRDAILAESVGVITKRNVAALFVVSATIAGLQGALSVFWYGFVNPDAYSFYGLVLAVAMVVVGGATHWAGPLVGAAFFTLVPEWLRPVGALKDVPLGVILLLTILFFREGVVTSLVTTIRTLRVQTSAEARARQPAKAGSAT